MAPLEAAIQGFTRLSEQQPDDFEIRALLTQSHRLLGDPQAVDFRHAWATLLLNLGRLQTRRTLFDDALRSLGQARDLLQPLVTAKPSYRRDLATALREPPWRKLPACSR